MKVSGWLALGAVLITGHAMAADGPNRSYVDEANSLIRAASAEAYFVNESSPKTPFIIRHKSSGLGCRFNPGEGNEVLVLTAVHPAGDDVACNGPQLFSSVSLYATRVSPQTGLDDALESAVTAFKVVRGGAGFKAFRHHKSVITDMLANPKIPANRTAEFVARDKYERISVAIVGEWEISMRISSEPRFADLVSTRGDVILLTAVADAEQFQKTGHGFMSGGDSKP